MWNESVVWCGWANIEVKVQALLGITWAGSDAGEPMEDFEGACLVRHHHQVHD